MRTSFFWVLTALVAGMFIGYHFFSHEPPSPEANNGQQTVVLTENPPQAYSQAAPLRKSVSPGKDPQLRAGPVASDRNENDQNTAATRETDKEKETETSPKTAQGLFERGLALDDDSTQEASSYRKALELDPEFAPAHYRLGAIYMRRAEFEKAEKHFALFWSMATRAEKEAYNIHLFTDEQTLEARLQKQAKRDVKDEQSGKAIPYRPDGNQVVVQVVLEGGIRSSMLLDTGASITVIAGRLARQGRYPVKGTINLHNVSPHEVSAKLVQVNSLELGPLSRQRLQMAVADIPSLNKKGIDGILGMDVLQGLSLRIDRKSREIILE